MIAIFEPTIFEPLDMQESGDERADYFPDHFGRFAYAAPFEPINDQCSPITLKPVN